MFSWSWRYSSVLQNLPGKYKVLRLIPSTKIKTISLFSSVPLEFLCQYQYPRYVILFIILRANFLIFFYRIFARSVYSFNNCFQRILLCAIHHLSGHWKHCWTKPREAWRMWHIRKTVVPWENERQVGETECCYRPGRKCLKCLIAEVAFGWRLPGGFAIWGWPLFVDQTSSAQLLV